jgi:hypothetical protein
MTHPKRPRDPNQLCQVDRPEAISRLVELGLKGEGTQCIR